jgi:peptide/nickel transport system substrate-binding protein
MNSKKLYSLLALLLIATVVLTACNGGAAEGGAEAGAGEEEAGAAEEAGAGEEAGAEEAPPVTVVIGTTDSISSLDFADAYAIHDWELFRNVNVGLMTFEPGTATVVPGAATGFEVSDDGLTYTFTLDSGWMYPDGSELVAGDFVREINRALTLEGDVAGLVVPYIESVEAPDDSTVVFHLDNPRGDFVQIITGAAYMPIQEGAYPDGELNKFPDTVVGVGPWQVTEYTVEEQLVLERNPNYKLGFADSAPDRVIIRYFQDATQMGLAVENGEIDVAWRILGPPEVQRLSGVEGLTAYNSGGGGIRYLVPNHIMEPMDSKEVRQAVAYLVDRDEIVDRVMQGTVDPLYSQVPSGFIGANEAFLDRYGAGPDVAAAEDLLTAAGYSADNPVDIQLWYPPEHYGTHAAQIFQVLEEQLEATPLVDVTLNSQEWGTYVGALVGGEYPIGYLGWFFDYPDTSNYLDPFAQSEAAASIGTNYSSEEMDSLLAAGGESTDPAERAQIYEDAQNLYAEDVVTLPLTIEPEYAVYNNATVSNIVIGPALYFQYELIEMVQ